MRRFLVVLAVAPLWACNWITWDEPECGEGEAFSSLARCSEAVEAELGNPPPDEWALMEPPLTGVRGDHMGNAIELRDRSLVVDLLGVRRTLHWPEPLPFAIQPGEAFVAQVDEASVTLFFSKGSLAFEPEGMVGRHQEGIRIGSLAASWEPGCESTHGTAMYLRVGSTSLAPGETAKIEGWTVTNLGAVLPSMRDCSVSGLVQPLRPAAWIAHSTEVRYECSSHPPPALVCSEETIAAHDRGREFDFNLGSVEDGTYKVIGVDSSHFLLRLPGSDAYPVINWPYELPVEIAEGDEVTIAHSRRWRVLSFPRGQLAVSYVHYAFTFEPPPTAPDGSGHLEGVAACALDDERAAMGVAIRDGSDEAFVIPGESATVGDWTYHLLFGWEAGPFACRKGDEVIQIGEGIGEGAIAAHRVFPH